VPKKKVSAKKVYTDTELLDILEKAGKRGYCPALLNDDAGHWAVSGEGMQNVPIDPPCDIHTTFFVEKSQWKKTVREAILAFIEDHYHG